MPADYILTQGDGFPVLSDTFTYPDGTPVDLTGATVTFQMRSMTSASLVPITGVVTIEAPTLGVVQYAPSTSDTATAGNYMANWVVMQAGATAPLTLPTVGWIWVEIQPNLATAPQQLVSLPDVKQWLRMDHTQRTYDDELLTLIAAAQPEVEAITGPIMPRIFDEWYDGGSNVISLRNRPSFGMGTSPVITIIAASEYRGPIEYPLPLIASPVFGSVYSVMLNPALGSLTRRTAGGGVLAFMPGRESTHVVYQAGQATVPPNVRLAMLEIVRVNFRSTAAAGRGFEAGADVESGGEYTLPFWIPRRAREMLAPTRRAPSIA